MNASVTAPCARERGAQVREVRLHRGAIDELDRPDAARALERLLAEHARRALRGARGYGARSRCGGRGWWPAKPDKPVLDVGGVADLARLAVADDVDAGGDLLRDGVGDAGRDGGIEGRRVVRLAVVFFVEQLDDLARCEAGCRRGSSGSARC